MCIGLPLWTLESWDQRLGTLGHELGHLRGRDTAQGRFVSGALQLTWSTWQLLEPEAWDEMWFDDVRFAGRINQVVMKVLAMPFGPSTSCWSSSRRTTGSTASISPTGAPPRSSGPRPWSRASPRTCGGFTRR